MSDSLRGFCIWAVHFIYVILSNKNTFWFVFYLYVSFTDGAKNLEKSSLLDPLSEDPKQHLHSSLFDNSTDYVCNYGFSLQKIYLAYKMR